MDPDFKTESSKDRNKRLFSFASPVASTVYPTHGKHPMNRIN